MYLWLKVTKDKLQLPLAVADNPILLAKMCNVSVNSIYSTVAHWEAGKRKHPAFIRVEIDDEE